jgi:hypothetical protein
VKPALFFGIGCWIIVNTNFSDALAKLPAQQLINLCQIFSVGSDFQRACLSLESFAGMSQALKACGAREANSAGMAVSTFSAYL